MVIEVSKEIDLRRIGIDRYSLKTGLNLRTVMDLSIEVLKEPRGFIRVLQCLMAILAFATTAGFSTECEFNIPCTGSKEDDELVTYEVEYPFSTPELDVPEECVDDDSDLKMLKITLPFDYSNTAEFFVATGVLSFLYTLIILVVYIFFYQTYAQNNRVPVIDLGITAVLSVFWLAGSSAWAQGVADLKHYLHPETLFSFLSICIVNKEQHDHECQTVEDGSYGTLNASLILGFANFLLWLGSLWFIYKETVFFQQPEPAPEMNQSQQTKGVGKV